MILKYNLLFFSLFASLSLVSEVAISQNPSGNPVLDEIVSKFLDSQSGRWRDMNIPEVDGKILYNLILENNLKSALEIGTSTGHSGNGVAISRKKSR